MDVPKQPKLFHITHLKNLSGICDRGLLSDAAVQKSTKTASTTVGMSKIKKRRLEMLRVESYPKTFVGDYVPFYFCPRSVMLYIIYKDNHDELSYSGGQEPIVHLQADLHEVVSWANSNSVKWAFTLGNAGAKYCAFRDDLADLDDLDWDAICTNSWKDCKDEKQAEFLVYQQVPWELIEAIGAKSPDAADQAGAIIASRSHAPTVSVKPSWYY